MSTLGLNKLCDMQGRRAGPARDEHSNDVKQREDLSALRISTALIQAVYSMGLLYKETSRLLWLSRCADITACRLLT